MAVKTLQRKISAVGGTHPLARRSARVGAKSFNIPTDDASAPFMSLVRRVTVDNADRQLPDAFSGLYQQSDDNVILEPEYPLRKLVEAGRANSTLNQCVEAYVVNIESYGYQLEYVGPVGNEGLPKTQAQKTAAMSFLDQPSGDKSLRKIREDSRRDKEYLGGRYFEIGRSLAGVPTFIEHVPGLSMRMTKKDTTSTPYETVSRTPDGKLVTRKWQKNFRRFVQVGSNGQKVWFKEFGDPRSIDPTTGKVNPSLPIEQQATEIWYDSIYAIGCNYGLPRWMGALPQILGTREAELVNLNFFRENTIPAMAILISGGALTAESYDKIVSVINAKRGKEAMNRIMILEASADDTVGDVNAAPPVPRMDMKPMTGERQNDALFATYQKDGKSSIRSTMRLPAIYTGDTEEYTKATAQAGKQVAESQVFLPERAPFDEFINHHILPQLGISLWKFKTTGPSVYDPDTLSTVLDRLSRNGAMTPNVLIKISNQILDVQIAPITSKWGDVPFSYTIGALAAGMQVDDFEAIYSVINDATAPTDPLTTDEGGNLGSNKPAPTPNATDGTGTAKPKPKPKTKTERELAALRAEMHAITGDLISRLNEHAPA